MEEPALRAEMGANESFKGIPTRRSLLSRLKNWNDDESWRTFFDTYWRLIYNTAARAGLNDAEAQDVVQETIISVSKSMPHFEYDPQKGSFKSWLLKLTRWRVLDQFRKRQQGIECLTRDSDTSTETAIVEKMADPGQSAFEAAWEDEWEKNLMEAAIERVKKKVDPKQYQAFDLYVLKKWPVLKVARTLKINPGMVYLTKHRIGNSIKREIMNLRSKPI